MRKILDPKITFTFIKQMFCSKEKDGYTLCTASSKTPSNGIEYKIFFKQNVNHFKSPVLINIFGNQFRKIKLDSFRWIYEILSSSSNFTSRFNRFLVEMFLLAIMETAMLVGLDQIRFGEANARRRNITTFQRGRLSRSFRIGVQLEIDPSSAILL